MNDSENPKSPLSRRAILGAAAWTAPAIVLTAASPANAASTPPPKIATVQITNAKQLTEAFTGPGFYVAYYGPNGIGGGWNLKGMEIAATFDGKPAAHDGNMINVILPAPFTFTDGSATRSLIPSATAVSYAFGAKDILVPPGTTAGSYTITVEYRGAVDTVTMTVLDGGTVWAWGVNNTGQADGLGPGSLARPYQWGYSSTRVGDDPMTYTSYTAITGSKTSLAAYSDLYHDVVTTGDLKGPYRRGLGSDLRGIVAGNNGQPTNATFLWNQAGQLCAFGENAADMFSLGDGSPASGQGKTYGTPVAVGTKILEANPGKTIVSVHTTGAYRASYLLSDGTVWSAGTNTGGAMGNKDLYGGVQHTATQTVLADGTPLTDIVGVACAAQTTIFLQSSGAIWGAGLQAAQAALPGGGSYNQARLTAVPLTQPEGKPVKKVWGHSGNHIVQATDDTCYFSGVNNYGMPSTGALGGGNNTWAKVIVPAGKTIADIGMRPTAALYLMTDGTLYHSGSNAENGPGNGSNAGSTLTMVKVPLNGTVVDFAITNDGSHAAIVR